MRKNEKERAANRRAMQQENEKVRTRYEAERDSAGRTRISPLRSHHRSSKNGTSESTKKTGPPRRWITLLIICGPALTQRRPITKMRKPFRRIASGMTKATSTRRRHDDFKNRLAAKTLVIKRTQLDRMPLHSCATSIVMFGNWKTSPARRKGVPLR